LKEWQKFVKAEYYAKYSKQVSDFPTQNGQANVSMNEISSVFCQKMQAYMDSYLILFTDVINIANQVS
jgi:hypothetical protein